jgi:hypothetical protein
VTAILFGVIYYTFVETLGVRFPPGTLTALFGGG